MWFNIKTHTLSNNVLGSSICTESNDVTIERTSLQNSGSPSSKAPKFSTCIAKIELTTTELLKAEFYRNVTLCRWANSPRRLEVHFHFSTLNMKAPRPFATAVTARPKAQLYFTDSIILRSVLLSPRHF